MLLVTSALNTTYLRNDMSHRQTKQQSVNVQFVPKSWPTFRDHWPRNG